MQFPLLRALGKRSVMHFLGSDIRGKPPEELEWAKRAGARVVGSYDAVRWVPDAHVIPPGIDVRGIDPAPPSDRERPVVAARAVVARSERAPSMSSPRAASSASSSRSSKGSTIERPSSATGAPT